MLRFNSLELSQKLECLPHVGRVEFALACAERMATVSVENPEPDDHHLEAAAMDYARRFVEGVAIDGAAMEKLASDMQHSPVLDRDDFAACVYLLDCLRSGDVQAAVWAAQRAYEARDLAAQTELEFSDYTPEVEAQLLGHPLVQAELSSQAADIGRLSQSFRKL